MPLVHAQSMLETAGQSRPANNAVCCSELEKETKANAVLFRNAFGTAPKKRSGILSALGFPNAFDTYLKNPANTNVVFWGNKLLALYEVTGQSAYPFSITGCTT